MSSSLPDGYVVRFATDDDADAAAELSRACERSVGLGVDSENPTGATRLYERAGMHAVSESVTFEKTLA